MTAPYGQTIANLNFGEFQTVTVSGEVFNDLNDSGSLKRERSGPLGLDRQPPQ